MKTNDQYLGFTQEKKYKLILVGDSNVGKTALFCRFIEGTFSNDKNTLVTTVDFKMKNITINSNPIKLYIWDTAGQEKYRSIVSTYFKGCHGVFLVFDLTKYHYISYLALKAFNMLLSNGMKYVRGRPREPAFS